MRRDSIFSGQKKYFISFCNVSTLQVLDKNVILIHRKVNYNVTSTYIFSKIMLIIKLLEYFSQKTTSLTDSSHFQLPECHNTALKIFKRVPQNLD